ncbi:MAG: dephospho-CoA kinase [Coriobacteriia bacterium]|nr:dephospho-CoA kinase [Coriobacteriia bacterium]
MIDRPPRKNPTPAPVQASVTDADAPSPAVPRMTLFICGPFGAGKSTVTEFVAAELTARGHEVCTILLDEIGHELLAHNQKLRDILVESFGDEILRPDGQIDRSALAAVSFADEVSQMALNAITHPPILTRAVEELARHATADFCVFEAPLPFSVLESTPGYGSEYLREARDSGQVIAVMAPLDVRLRRVCEKGFTADDACARMAVQPDEDAYLACADLRLDNKGDLSALRQATSELVDTLCR